MVKQTMTLKITYKDGREERVENIDNIAYHTNSNNDIFMFVTVGDVMREHTSKTVDLKTVETFVALNGKY